MPAKYMMRIEKIVPQTKDSKSFILVPIGSDKGLFDYLPGQFFTLEAEIFRPKNLTYDSVRKIMVGSGENVKVTERKAFSLVSSPTEDGFVELLIKSEGGTFVPYFLEQAQVGDECMLSGPQGNFMSSIFKNKEKFIACWSAGSGIPSTISLMKYVMDNDLDTKIIVFDSNKTADEIVYHERILELVNNSENFSCIFALTRGNAPVTPSSGTRVKYFNGRFWSDENTLEKYAMENWKDYFNTICGSSSFINGKTRDEQGKLVKIGKGIEDYLLELGIPQSRLDKDQFYLQ